MRRRVVVTSLVAGLVLSAAVLPAAGAEVGSVACPGGARPAAFEDVAAASTHAAAIDCASQLGIVRGTSATRFSPGASLTRGQLASLVVGSLQELGVDLPPLAGAPTFSDVGRTHGDNIRRLAAAGVVSGRSDGSFAPDVPVSRGQLASVLVGALEYVRTSAVVPAERGRFSDVSGGAHAANIDAAAGEGLLSGRADGRFLPTALTRRDQAATVLVRLIDATRTEVLGEVWALDQGTDTIHVYRADQRTEIARIDVTPTALKAAGFAAAPTGASTVPHMIEFDSRERYAFVASTAGAVTIVIDARTKAVVEVIPTGAGSHMAAVTPDDSALWVAAIGARRLVEIPLDLSSATPTFAIGRNLSVETLLGPTETARGWTYPSYAPVCHQFSPDSSEAWVTLGPGWNQGGFFVLDLASGSVSAAWDPAQVKANCGISVTEDRVIANWSGKVVAGEDTEGQWYVFDRRTKELLATEGSGGFDAHGVRLTPDGSSYWMVNRASSDAIVIDARTFQVTRAYADIAKTPDIIDFSPDSSLIYISQRGPTPRSGATHAATGSEPGVRVVSTATGETVAVIRPPEAREAPSVEHPDGRVRNDVHGLGVRARGTGVSQLGGS
jgi:DNA-binding beta-propeller fold protein YncE